MEGPRVLVQVAAQLRLDVARVLALRDRDDAFDGHLPDLRLVLHDRLELARHRAGESFLPADGEQAQVDRAAPVADPADDHRRHHLDRAGREPAQHRVEAARLPALGLEAPPWRARNITRNTRTTRLGPSPTATS